MSYKSILLALLVLSVSGCAVYGGGSGYGHRGYDRGHSTTYYQVQRYPVYVVPQPRYKAHQHDGRRYDDYRQPSRYYVPAPHSRHYQVAQPYARWDGRRDRDTSRKYQQHQQPRQQRHNEQRGGDRHEDNQRGWERQRN